MRHISWYNHSPHVQKPFEINLFDICLRIIFKRLGWHIIKTCCRHGCQEKKHWPLADPSRQLPRPFFFNFIQFVLKNGQYNRYNRLALSISKLGVPRLGDTGSATVYNNKAVSKNLPLLGVLKLWLCNISRWCLMEVPHPSCFGWSPSESNQFSPWVSVNQSPVYSKTHATCRDVIDKPLT